ncbi:methyltransferase domain-containing protein [Candidatus Latescibacterota bacterium]
MTESGSYVERLDTAAPLRMEVLQMALRQLGLRSGSSGLDAGCGTGHVSLLLAEEVGADGHVICLDVDAVLLAAASQRLEDAGYGSRIALREGDVAALPFADNAFDWAVSVDCLGYAAAVPMAGIGELARVVRPDGQVAVLAWSSERMLPGYPQLEARLHATRAGLAPYVGKIAPERDFLHGLTWLRRVGLRGARASTFVGQVCAPLRPELREAMADLFGMRWPGAAADLTAEDGAEFQRLCSPQSPDFIVDHPDYYAFFTYTMLVGTVVN